MSELEQTIEELEAEVLAELEEGQHAKSDPQMKGAAPAEGQKKLDKKTPGGEVEDGGAAVVDPEAKSSPTDVAAKGAAEIGGDAQQKGENPAEPMKKIKKVSEEEDHESDEDSEVIEEGVDVKRPDIGVLIEVPAAVYQARLIAKEADFIAVGSNDLTQYLLAVDRNNPRVANLYQEVHPAVIAALREVARAAHAEERPLGICGELAGTPAGAILLMAMGYHVLSMNATHLLRVKWVIRNIKRSDARRMLARVLQMDTAEEVTAFLHKDMVRLGLSKVMPARSTTQLH